jgi:myo-inositol-1(or 4)-monophosphatase
MTAPDAPAGASAPPPGLTPAEVDELTVLAAEAARAAGDLIRAGDGSRPAVASTKSSPTDVVTAMDRASERLLRDFLAERRPDDGLFGEEEDGLRAGTTGLTWVLDPIDGTVNYLYRIPVYAVSVAVVTGDPRVPGAWSTVAGCVHDVVAGQSWTAGTGRGARLDGVELRPGPTPGGPPPGAGTGRATDLSHALVATGFGYRPERRAHQARVFAEIAPHIRDLRRIGSASLDLCMVAAGRIDLFYERGLNVWDLAAAALVVREAGGAIAGLEGRPLGERTVIAGDAALCERLAPLLVAAGADADGV